MRKGETPRLIDRRQVLKTMGLAGAGGIAGAAAVNALAPTLLPEETVFEPNHSYWSLVLPPKNPPLMSHLEADVVVIGGGFTGLSAAYYLTESLPTKKVALLEATRCGNGASGRNGAMVLNLKHTEGEPEINRRMYQLTVDNVETLRKLSEAAGMDCELDQHGALTVMNSANQASQAQTDLRVAHAHGLPLEYWDKIQTAAAIGTPVYAGAVFDPGAGQVHPGKLLCLWKSLAEKGGVHIFEDTPVTAIREGALHSITTRDGFTVRAPLLVLATNAYTSKLGLLRAAVAPIFNYIGITPKLEPEQLRELNWKIPIPFNDNRQEVYYAGFTRDGRVHFGGGPVDYGFNNALRTPTNAAQRHAKLHREFGRVFPLLANVPFESQRSGIVDVSLDQNPAVGRMGRWNNILYGIGYSGEGVNLTSVFGRIIADLAAGKAEHWQWFPFLNRRPPYIPNEPFRWLAVEADLAYSRLTGA